MYDGMDWYTVTCQCLADVPALANTISIRTESLLSLSKVNADNIQLTRQAQVLLCRWS